MGKLCFCDALTKSWLLPYTVMSNPTQLVCQFNAAYFWARCVIYCLYYNYDMHLSYVDIADSVTSFLAFLCHVSLQTIIQRLAS